MNNNEFIPAPGVITFQTTFCFFTFVQYCALEYWSSEIHLFVSKSGINFNIICFLSRKGCDVDSFSCTMHTDKYEGLTDGHDVHDNFTDISISNESRKFKETDVILLKGQLEKLLPKTEPLI